MYFLETAKREKWRRITRKTTVSQVRNSQVPSSFLAKSLKQTPGIIKLNQQLLAK